MRSAAPAGTNGGGRLRSQNERLANRLKDSRNRVAVCSLCMVPGHRVGRMCTVVMDLNVQVVPKTDVEDFCMKLGNPTAVTVSEPDFEQKSLIKLSMEKVPSIPPGVKHIVVCACFHSARREDTYSMNAVEVILLGDTGIRMVTAVEKNYFPAHAVASWIKKNCKGQGRKKHLLSSLLEASPLLSQEFYDYSP